MDEDNDKKTGHYNQRKYISEFLEYFNDNTKNHVSTFHTNMF